VEISWLGHSCFRLRSGDVTLVMDPYAETVGFPSPSLTARIVTVSNSHPHHSNWTSIQGSPRVLTGPGEYEIAGAVIDAVRTPSRPGQESPNTAFVVEMDGITLCHLGDLSQPLTTRLVGELGRVQVLLVPAGGRCTLPPAQAAEVVTLLDPRLVIPMHFKTPGCSVDLEPAEPFLRELGVREPTTQARLNVTAANLPREGLSVVLLQQTS